MNSQPDPGHTGNFGLAWLFLCVAFCAHVADETLTGFLDVYNPTVLAVRAQHPWFTMPTFKIPRTVDRAHPCERVVLAADTARISEGALAAPGGLFLRLRTLLNGLGHTMATIFGRTVSAGSLPPTSLGLLLLATTFLRFDLSRVSLK